MDDDDLMIVGSSAPNSLQLADHLLNIPIFSALVSESDREYDVLLKGDTQEIHNMTVKELEAMKLPPKPQLKGFEPLRTKANVRALDLLMRDMKSNIRTLMMTPDRRG